MADEKLREIIVKDLSDIKSKLDCLSLKDLDSSCSFLKEGVELLKLALDKLSEDQKASESSSDEATRVVNNTASGVLNAALSLLQAIQKLKVSCDKRFQSAKERFKASRERATDVFNNKSLSIKDRIMACKLRVAATILESGLEDPEAATIACLLSLKELHSLPTIQEMFAVFFKGGLKSMFKKPERLEYMMSVLLINHALYDFASKYSNKSCNPFTWPEIELKDRTFHPILNAHEILTKKSIGEELVQQLSRVITNSSICFNDFAVNTRGDLIVLMEEKIMIICSTGERKDLVFPDTAESNVIVQWRKSVAVDSNDNIYALTRLRTRNANGSAKSDLVLYVFDESYNIKLVSVLEFLDKGKGFVKIAVDKNQNIIMITDWSDQVCVCDNTGKLKFQFERDWRYMRCLNISTNNDIMMTSDDDKAVKIYSTEGNLKFTIKVLEGHNVREVAFHHSIGKVIVLTYAGKQNSWFLLCHSQTGELEHSVSLERRHSYHLWRCVDMKSHPSGPFVVKVGKSITFI